MDSRDFSKNRQLFIQAGQPFVRASLDQPGSWENEAAWYWDTLGVNPFNAEGFVGAGGASLTELTLEHAFKMMVNVTSHENWTILKRGIFMRPTK